ncbi:MAG: hypothetical protein ABJD24_03885 [Acidimicrobiales bacterium]
MTDPALLTWGLAVAARAVAGDVASENDATLLEHFVSVHDVEGVASGSYRLRGSRLQPGSEGQHRDVAAHLCFDQPLGGDSTRDRRLGDQYVASPTRLRLRRLFPHRDVGREPAPHREPLDLAVDRTNFILGSSVPGLRAVQHDEREGELRDTVEPDQPADGPVREADETSLRAPIEFPLATAAQHDGDLTDATAVNKWRAAATSLGTPALAEVEPPTSASDDPIETVILRRGSTRLMRHETVLLGRGHDAGEPARPRTIGLGARGGHRHSVVIIPGPVDNPARCA